ncbi:M14 family metallopeptidase [Pleionea litopenaei]|uniref:M14 family metallopeptidase n=1 Tax=Pleionea litopenaei TaxID=3070815 RepID=A0AA51X8B2_9GAMM|nr:M14 family metallopeptidase [Pleionea sp. HL-JVS1]WMS89197.1 M14 family metallopeptidase [Pleionea sp. HL-JVS1]
MKYLSLLIVAFFSLGALSKPDTSFEYYFQPSLTLDPQASFNPDIPTPQSVLGYSVGDWHVRPEQIAEYMYALAQTSDRVWVEEMGRSYEQRPLLLVSFSSSNNIKKIDAIKAQRKAFLTSKESAPSIVWMGYSVHGNEASGANAALLLAYYLAAAQGEQVEKLLNNTVILMEPMINPDGIARFAHWVNSRKSQQWIADPNDVEHDEAWPQGRTNHYWFDLNRDWLLVQHPESQARLKSFHQWKPLVVTDFHEMGTNSSYFFQPGVPSRQNPKTPQQNFDLTARIAEYHARALDSIGSRYYSKEGFDDFYYGKGSTYPDINGAVGILFEQASARGHIQNSVNGPVSFPFAIRNQLATSFSTLKAVLDEASALKRYQKSFYQQVNKLADDHKVKAYVFDADGDKRRLNEFLDILDTHQVDYFQLARDIKVSERNYEKSEAYIVPLEQPQFRLIRNLFETETQFKDNTFYDVSSWTLALSFNLDFSSLNSSDYSSRLRGKEGRRELADQLFTLRENTIAVAFDWRDFNTAPLVTRLQKQNVTLKVMTKDSVFEGVNGNLKVAAGSIILPLGEQVISRERLAYLLGDELKALPVATQQITSGLAKSGVDIGSPTVMSLVTPKPLLIVGDGVSSYEAGEVWHLLDQRLEIPLVKITQQQLQKIPLHAYTHIIMVSGRYSLTEEDSEKLSAWIDQGGQLIASRTAGRWLAKQLWGPIHLKVASDEPEAMMNYSEREQFHAEKVIGGAIFQTRLDLSHPLAYGIERSMLPMFRRGTDVYEVDQEEPFATVAHFLESPLLSGYASSDNQKALAKAPAIVAVRKGKGGITYYADNMNFRAFWWGTSKVFINSLYFSYAYWSSAN